jgi:hypothetical protein
MLPSLQKELTQQFGAVVFLFMVIIILGILLMIICTIVFISFNHGLIALGAFLFVAYSGF